MIKYKIQCSCGVLCRYSNEKKRNEASNYFNLNDKLYPHSSSFCNISANISCRAERLEVFVLSMYSIGCIVFNCLVYWQCLTQCLPWLGHSTDHVHVHISFSLSFSSSSVSQYIRASVNSTWARFKPNLILIWEKLGPN